MIDFIRIGFNTKNKSKVFISAQRRFEDVALSYEILSGKKNCPITTKFVNKDLLITKNIYNLMNSLYKFYSGGYVMEDNSPFNFTYENLCCALDSLVAQFPFLERTQMAQLEFGFNFENPNDIELINKKTTLLFKGGYSSLRTTLLPTAKGQIDNKNKCSDMAVKINFEFKSNWVTI
jgi:hypothetical protein